MAHQYFSALARLAGPADRYRGVSGSISRNNWKLYTGAKTLNGGLSRGREEADICGVRRHLVGELAGDQR